MSFFQLIEDLSKQIRKSPKGKGLFNPAPLHRLCTLMRKLKAKAVLKEKLKPNQELKDELTMAQRRTNKKVRLEATRLTFFCSYPEEGKWNDPDTLPAEHILGYAVLVTLHIQGGHKRMYILEAVVRPPSVITPIPESLHAQFGSVHVVPVTNCYVHNTRTFSTRVGPKTKSRQFEFIGAFFAQQNDLTHVCAHAALRTAVNSSPEFGAVKLTNKKINDILRIDFTSPKKSVGHFKYDQEQTRGGLTADQIGKVAAGLGGSVHVAHFTVNADIEYDQYIYPVLESGYPVILGIEGWDVRKARPLAHAVAVLGHTLDSDRWSPQARAGYGSFPLEKYIPVTAWCDHYIVSDDNYGMFVTLPADMIRNFIVPSKNPNLHAMVAVTMLPRAVKIRGYAAEQTAICYARQLIDGTSLTPPPRWLEHLKARSDRLICRTVLCTAKEYRRHIKDHARGLGVDISAVHWRRLRSLPRFLWVSEISIPNIYEGNKHKLGDVVLQANATKKEHLKGESLVLAWFPGFAYFKGAVTVDSSWFINSHVPFLRDGPAPALEW